MNRFEEAVPGLTGLNGLESKIRRVIERIQSLKQENSELRRDLERLRGEREEQASKLEEMERTLADALANRRDVVKEEAIRKKVAGLLERLENL